MFKLIIPKDIEKDMRNFPKENNILILKKIEELKRYIENNNIEIDIEADGGINLATAPDVKKAGANILVSGTAILMANDFKVIIDELKK